MTKSNQAMKQTRHAYNSNQYPPKDHELLEFVRRLHERHYFSTQHQEDTKKQIQKNFQGQHATPFDKLVAYAKALDDHGTLSKALSKARLPFVYFAKVWVIGYFVMGVVSAYGLLYGHFVNFFYLLMILLGWHSISLFIWCFRPKNHVLFSVLSHKINHMFQKANHQDVLTKTAYDTLLQTNQQKHPWQVASLIHQAWIFALLGNILGLLLLFLSKSYAFVWESTLLSQEHIAKLVKILAIIPTWFGFDLPHTGNSLDNNASQLALLLMISLVIYGILPRFMAFLYCKIQCHRHHFIIDGQLYFYDNLLRYFNQTITNPNDYQAPTPTPTQACPKTDKKIVACLEYQPADEFWYQFGTGTDVVEIGLLDEKRDFARLKQAIDEHRLSVYLGIGVHILPDRGITRKLALVNQLAQFGLMVELLGEDKNANQHEFYPQWQQVLAQYGIDEVRYH